jgi:hypothetical protein
MNPSLKKLYIDLINCISNNRNNFRESDLCLFTPAKGREYDGEILFVGRSPNGWDYKIKKENDEDYKRLIDDISPKYDDERVNNLNWVEEAWGRKEKGMYNTKKSAFWRVIIKITKSFYQREDIKMVHKVSWNNLYKVSHAERGNPSSKLAKVQLDLCISILNLEIEDCNPKHVIFLTGMNGWAGNFLKMEEFINLTDEFIKAQADKPKFLEFIGVNKNSKRVYIVSQHPQRKKEDPLVKEILEGLKFATEYLKNH